MNHKRVIPRDPPVGLVVREDRSAGTPGGGPGVPQVATGRREATASATNRSTLILASILASPLGPRTATGGTRLPPESGATKSGEEPEA
jgi:hypothetical protein